MDDISIYNVHVHPNVTTVKFCELCRSIQDEKRAVFILYCVFWH